LEEVDRIIKSHPVKVAGLIVEPIQVPPPPTAPLYTPSYFL
jgi:hypothetical protein